MANPIGEVDTNFWQSRPHTPPRQANKRTEVLKRAMKMVQDNLRSRFPLHVLRLPDMQLTNVMSVTYQLEGEIQSEFLDSKHPLKKPEIQRWVEEKTGYAVLSHRWGLDELTFQDVVKMASFTKKGIEDYIGAVQSGQRDFKSSDVIQSIRDRSAGTPREPGFNLLDELKNLRPHISEVPGFIKLINFCELALALGCTYAWLDTGCIDKTNSTELSESIRTMFRWYRSSKVCIVHLAGTTTGPDLDHDPWFTRGWTLQELLAPTVIKFYNSQWRAITGETNDKAATQNTSPLIQKMSEITRISADDLHDFKPGLANIRERLGWASSRMTTRIEDMAYSLFGVFDINVSVLYGEKEEAFYRFQEEMIRKTPDQGMFLWNGKASHRNSFLAESPQNFTALGRELKAYSTSGYSAPYFTAYGLMISLPLHDVEPVVQNNEISQKSFVFNLTPVGSPAAQPEMTELAAAEFSDSNFSMPTLRMQPRKDGKPRIVLRSGTGRVCKHSSFVLSPRKDGTLVIRNATPRAAQIVMQPRKDGGCTFMVSAGGTRQEPIQAVETGSYSRIREAREWAYTPDRSSSGGEAEPTFKIAVLAASSADSLGVLLIKTDGNDERPSYRRVPGSPVFSGDWPRARAEKVIIK